MSSIQTKTAPETMKVARDTPPGDATAKTENGTTTNGMAHADGRGTAPTAAGAAAAAADGAKPDTVPHDTLNGEKSQEDKNEKVTNHAATGTDPSAGNGENKAKTLEAANEGRKPADAGNVAGGHDATIPTQHLNPIKPTSQTGNGRTAAAPTSAPAAASSGHNTAAAYPYPGQHRPQTKSLSSPQQNTYHPPVVAAGHQYIHPSTATSQYQPPTSMLEQKRAATHLDNLHTYSTYPPVHGPTAEQIESSIPSNASAIFHVLDRRINFDSYPQDASMYSLIRAWMWDDPYRCNPPRVLRDEDRVDIGVQWSLHPRSGVDGSDGPLKRKRRPLTSDTAISQKVDVLSTMRYANNPARPYEPHLELRSITMQHVEWAKAIRADVERIDREKIKRARTSLSERFGVSL